MKFQFPGNGARLFGRESGMKRGWLVGVQVVEHDTDRLGFGIQTDEMAHTVGQFNQRPVFHDQYLAPTPLGFADHHRIAYPVARVFGILPSGFSGSCRNRLANLADELLRTFVETHHRMCRIVRSGIDIKGIFHRGNELGADFRQVPFLDLPGLQGVFSKGVESPHG
jgi:hypothetical protein